jgi:flagellar hook-associated protein 1 FlgK
VSDSLSIASSSLDAMRAAMATTSENIANAQTPGYVDESAQLSALPGGDALGVGDGVQVTTVAQAANALLAANNSQAQGSLANLSALQQVLTGVENLFPLGNSTSSTSGTSANDSLAGDLASFWSQWDSVAADPTAPAPLTQLVTMAQGITQNLNETSSALSSLATNAQGQLTQQISQVNGLLSQAAQLNQSILTQGGSGTGAGANQQVDQLNAVVGQLSQLAGVTVSTQQNGTAFISIGGIALVQGDQASSLADSTTGGVTSITTQPGGVAVPVSGGSIAGLLAGVNQYIPQFQSELDSVASALATTVNTQLAAGYTTSGVSGATEPMFTGSSASTIAVNPTVVANPALLAVASTTGAAAANDGSNAQAMAELGASAGAPDADYQKLVGDIGAATQNVNSQVTVQTSVANQAQQSLQAVTGVNQDQELTNLMQFQQIYQASAKLITVVDTAVQSLLSAV